MLVAFISFRNDPSVGIFSTGDDGQEFFFFITDWKESGVPVKGAAVTFETKEGKKGAIATNIKLA